MCFDCETVPLTHTKGQCMASPDQILELLRRHEGHESTFQPMAGDAYPRGRLLTTFAGERFARLKAKTQVVLESATDAPSCLLVLSDQKMLVCEDGSDFSVKDDARLINPPYLTVRLRMPVVAPTERGWMADDAFCRVLSDKSSTLEDIAAAVAHQQRLLGERVNELLGRPSNREMLVQLTQRFFPDEPDRHSRFSWIDTAQMVRGGACSPR